MSLQFVLFRPMPEDAIQTDQSDNLNELRLMALTNVLHHFSGWSKNEHIVFNFNKKAFEQVYWKGFWLSGLPRTDINTTPSRCRHVSGSLSWRSWNNRNSITWTGHSSTVTSCQMHVSQSPRFSHPDCLWQGRGALESSGQVERLGHYDEEFRRFHWRCHGNFLGWKWTLVASQWMEKMWGEILCDEPRRNERVWWIEYDWMKFRKMMTYTSCCMNVLKLFA